MEKEQTSLSVTGGIISSILAAATGAWETILVIFALYALALFGNLVTGLLYAHQTDTYDKKIATKAIYKKGGMIAGIMVLAIIDIILIGLAKTASVPYNVPFLTCLLAGYAGIHELTSMLTNIKKLGNKVPAAIENVAKKAGEALNQGKIPDISILPGKGDNDEDNQ